MFDFQYLIFNWESFQNWSKIGQKSAHNQSQNQIEISPKKQSKTGAEIGPKLANNWTQNLLQN
jgi:hypothetical protein